MGAQGPSRWHDPTVEVANGLRLVVDAYNIKFRKPNDREIRRLMLADAIADIHARSRGTYGILRVKAALEIEQGLIVNTKLVKRSCGNWAFGVFPGQR
jgi:HTH-like domain